MNISYKFLKLDLHTVFTYLGYSNNISFIRRRLKQQNTKAEFVFEGAGEDLKTWLCWVCPIMWTSYSWRCLTNPSPVLSLVTWSPLVPGPGLVTGMSIVTAIVLITPPADTQSQRSSGDSPTSSSLGNWDQKKPSLLSSSVLWQILLSF